jgi:hypothetical protein
MGNICIMEYPGVALKVLDYPCYPATTDERSGRAYDYDLV